MTNETLRMQMLSGIITEGQYKAKLQENKKKKSLKESMIGGIVGIGAINQIPPRAKADYELAFEHFLGERYENREQDPYTMKEAKDLSFTFNYNTDEDDVAYIQRLLKQAGVDATAKAGIDSEEMVVKASNAIELRKAKKAISSDGFQIHENREQDPYTMKEEEEEEEDYGTNIVTGKKLPKPDPIVEEEVNEGKLDGLYMELKDVLFPYYTDLRGEERVSMIDDVIKELNSYILILQDEKKAKQ
jgi:hypothetical protein